MHITHLRISGFQSFGPNPTTIELSKITYVLGPNGAGKTAVLEALSRLFSPLPTQRKIRRTDFHVPSEKLAADANSDDLKLWIEADMELPESGKEGDDPSVPPNFAHMRLHSADGVPRIRVRLSAAVARDDVIEEKLEYVVEADDRGEPVETYNMSRLQRSTIEVYYLPARRDPAELITYTATSLIGRALRAANWETERSTLDTLSEKLTDALSANAAVRDIGVKLAREWSGLHSGTFLTNPTLTFGNGDLESVLRQLNISFTPSPYGSPLPIGRLSDGQKSLLYISLVLAWQSLARDVLQGSQGAFDQHRLRPPVHTIIALEEPENSLAPQYLGRIIRQLREAANYGGSQSLIATHAPALLRRVDPEQICFLRLDQKRQSEVRRIVLPESSEESSKYVREAVLAYPELYFSRLVVLGEGQSEQIVLPRILAAAGIAEDDASVTVVPLGGRHVNHFWRLLNELKIPHVTLLDLDSGRHGGGWGRVRNALKQLNRLDQAPISNESIEGLPAWDAPDKFPELVDSKYPKGFGPIAFLETNGVYFSDPIDIDFMMLEAFPSAYGGKLGDIPSDRIITAVLGKTRANEDQLPERTQRFFHDYHRLFNLKSKPATHLGALSVLSDNELLDGLPHTLKRLVNAVKSQLESVHE